MPGPLGEADKARVRELIAKSDLVGIFFHEQSARRHDASGQQDAGAESQAQVGIQFRLAGDEFGVRLTAELQNEVGTANVSVAGEYRISDTDYRPTRRDVMMFANEVAVMTVYPYLREGVSDITLKVLGEAVLMPIAPRGAIGFDIEDASTDAGEIEP